MADIAYGGDTQYVSQPQVINGDAGSPIVDSEDSTTTAPVNTDYNVPDREFNFDFETAQDAQSRDDLAKTQEIDITLEPESWWSNIRASGTSKEDAVTLGKAEAKRLVKEEGYTAVDAVKSLGLDKPVQWNREKYERAEAVRSKVSEVSTMYSSLNINLDDIAKQVATGKMTQDTKDNIVGVGEALVKNGTIARYDVATATGWTADDIPVSLTKEGFWDVINTNKNLIGTAVVAGMVIASAPISVPVGVGLGAGAAFFGKMADMGNAESILNDQFDAGLDIPVAQYVGEASKEALVDIAGAKLIDGIVKTAGLVPAGSRRLMDYLTNKDYAGGVRIISEMLNQNRKELKVVAKDYAKLKGLDPTDLNERDWDKLILESQAISNPAFKGHVAGATTDKKAQIKLLEALKFRESELAKVGKSLSLLRVKALVEAVHKRAGTVIASTRTAIDKSFRGVDIDTTPIQASVDNILNVVSSPEMSGVFREVAPQALAKVYNVLNSITENGVTMGDLFRLKTSYGALLRKAGLWEDDILKRSTKLGDLGGQHEGMASVYFQIDKFIDDTIDGAVALTQSERSTLLTLKHASDDAFANIMGALNTQVMKSTARNSRKQIESFLDDMFKLARAGHEDYDAIMGILTPKAQARVEGAIVKHIITKDETDIVKIAENLTSLLPKIGDTKLKRQTQGIIQASKLFTQDPLLRSVALARRLPDKLAKAGLSDDPWTSLRYTTWARTYAKLQVSAVNLVGKVGIDVKSIPILDTIAETAEDIVLTRVIGEALKSSDGSFKNFLDHLIKSNSVKGRTRRLAVEGLRMYNQLARDFDAPQAERIREAMALHERRQAQQAKARSDARDVDYDVDVIDPDRSLTVRPYTTPAVSRPFDIEGETALPELPNRGRERGTRGELPVARDDNGNRTQDIGRRGVDQEIIDRQGGQGNRVVASDKVGPTPALPAPKRTRATITPQDMESAWDNHIAGQRDMSPNDAWDALYKKELPMKDKGKTPAEYVAGQSTKDYAIKQFRSNIADNMKKFMVQVGRNKSPKFNPLQRANRALLKELTKNNPDASNIKKLYANVRKEGKAVGWQVPTIKALARNRRPSKIPAKKQMPRDLQDNFYTDVALTEAEDILAADIRYATRKGSKEGTIVDVGGEDWLQYIPPDVVDNPIGDRVLTARMVKRIRAGKGKEEDFEALRTETERLQRQDEAEFDYEVGDL